MASDIDNLSAVCSLSPRGLGYAVSNRVLSKSVSYRYPLLPFWISPSGGTSRGTRLYGNDFLIQNFYKENEDADPTVFPGYQTFRQVDRSDSHTQTGTGHTYCDDPSSASFSKELSYQSGSLVETITGDLSLSGEPSISFVETATTWHYLSTTYHYDYPDGVETVIGSDTYTYDASLSLPVTRGWLGEELAGWKALSDSEKGSSPSTWGSYSSDSAEGWRASVSFAETKATCTSFAGGASGMVGDFGAYWNGNFSTWLVLEETQNIPIAWWVQSASELHRYSGAELTGLELYKEGYSESTFSEELVDQWVDATGVYEMGIGAGWESALAGVCYRELNTRGVPMLDNDKIRTYTRGGEFGECNEVMLVSATGNKYRVTFEFGTTYPLFEPLETYVLETDAASLQATYQFGAEVRSLSGRVALVERWQMGESGEMEWFVLADIAEWDAYQAEYKSQYDPWLETYNEWQDAWYIWDESGQWGPEPVEPDPFVFNPPEGFPEIEPLMPGQLIGTKPGNGIHLLSSIKYRAGVKFGFLGHIPSAGRRFARVDFQRHWTPPSGSNVTGSYDEVFYQTYVDGELKPMVVTERSAIINGVDWTPSVFYGNYSLTGGAYVVDTVTQRRQEISGGYGYNCEIGFDYPGIDSKVITTSYVKADMSYSGGVNTTAWMGIDDPGAGRTVGCVGHRLTPG